MRRVSAVIDAWFDSGSMPWAQFHYPFENEELFEERFPARHLRGDRPDPRLVLHPAGESVLLFDTSSYRNCVCLGLILDPEGQKMSKSRGNVVEPWDVIERHGATPSAGTTSPPSSPGPATASRSIRSERRFASSCSPSGTPIRSGCSTRTPRDSSPRGLPEPGAASRGDTARRGSWIAGRFPACSGPSPLSASMDNFDCTTAGSAIADYGEELSNWYVRLSRRQFWEGDAAAFATLRHCLITLSTMLAPFTPFLADEIYTNLGGGADEEFGDRPTRSISQRLPDARRGLIDDELEAGMEAVRRTVELGRAARARAGEGRQPLRKAVVVALRAERAAIERLSEIVASELGVKEIEFVHEEADWSPTG